jgi:hypothetical protein
VFIEHKNEIRYLYFIIFQKMGKTGYAFLAVGLGVVIISKKNRGTLVAYSPKKEMWLYHRPWYLNGSYFTRICRTSAPTVPTFDDFDTDLYLYIWHASAYDPIALSLFVGAKDVEIYHKELLPDHISKQLGVNS